MLINQQERNNLEAEFKKISNQMTVITDLYSDFLSDVCLYKIYDIKNLIIIIEKLIFSIPCNDQNSQSLNGINTLMKQIKNLCYSLMSDIDTSSIFCEETYQYMKKAVKQASRGEN